MPERELWAVGDNIYGQDDNAATVPGYHSVANLNDSRGWVIAMLFLGFGLISVLWDLLIAALSYINSKISGRKAKWLGRHGDRLFCSMRAAHVLDWLCARLLHS